jgi:hypothetical protein
LILAFYWKMRTSMPEAVDVETQGTVS